MQNNQPNGYSRAASVTPDIPQRSLLSSLFILSLGVIYPAFLCLVFLKPELLEHLFNSSSGYLISGLGLILLGVCFVLATAHFRSADRQYRQASDHTHLPPHPLSNLEVRHHHPTPSQSQSALRAHKHNHPGE